MLSPLMFGFLQKMLALILFSNDPQVVQSSITGKNNTFKNKSRSAEVKDHTYFMKKTFEKV